MYIAQYGPRYLACPMGRYEWDKRAFKNGLFKPAQFKRRHGHSPYLPHIESASGHVYTSDRATCFSSGHPILATSAVHTRLDYNGRRMPRVLPWKGQVSEDNWSTILMRVATCHSGMGHHRSSATRHDADVVMLNDKRLLTRQ